MNRLSHCLASCYIQSSSRISGAASSTMMRECFSALTGMCACVGENVAWRRRQHHLLRGGRVHGHERLL